MSQTNKGSLPTPSIRRRLASMLYEFLLLIGVVFLGFLLPNTALGAGANILLPSSILIVHAMLVIALYFIWFWRRDGRTLAMKTWKIQLLSADGTALPIERMILRFLLAWPSILFFGAGLIWAVFDRDRQFLHDRLAGTRLVYTG